MQRTMSMYCNAPCIAMHCALHEGVRGHLQAREIPWWLALGYGRLCSAVASRVTGVPPTAPADLVRTATSGTLLFDSRRSDAELRVRCALRMVPRHTTHPLKKGTSEGHQIT